MGYKSGRHGDGSIRNGMYGENWDMMSHFSP